MTGGPRIRPERRNEARRFMTLIDTLYRRRVNLVFSADGSPEALYPEGEGTEEFQRTVLRLIEMGTREYIVLPHVGWWACSHVSAGSRTRGCVIVREAF